MDFEVTYTEEQQRFRREVRAWLETNVPASVSPSYLELRDLGRKLRRQGLALSDAPAKYGGGASTSTTPSFWRKKRPPRPLAAAYYDSAAARLRLDPRLGAPRSSAQAFLPAIYRGEVRTWQLLTEPGAGSDLAACRMTTAVRDGEEYVIKARRSFVAATTGPTGSG